MFVHNLGASAAKNFMLLKSGSSFPTETNAFTDRFAQNGIQ